LQDSKMRDVSSTRASNAPPFRLPDTVKPIHYDLEIEPDLSNSIFNGKVVVDLIISKSTNIIAFHAVSIKITHATVKPATSGTIHPEVQYQPENEIAYVRLEEKLPAGSAAILTLNYAGEINEPGSMGGLFSTPYHMPSGGVKLGFETMMAPSMARTVFPCFDEPDLKARFTISIVADSDLTCLSNMEVTSTKPAMVCSGEPKKSVAFKTTPKMSTYLVVMIAGYFNVTETNDFHVPIRIWAPLDKDIGNAAYALDIAVKAMKAHEKNFDLKYPLPKLDMVAIPGHQGSVYVLLLFPPHTICRCGRVSSWGISLPKTRLLGQPPNLHFAAPKQNR
jgi:aminopeptidase 2